MLSIKKIFAVLLIATFLVSTPLALACINPEVCSVTFVYKYDDAPGKPPGSPGKGPPDKGDQGLGYEFLMNGYKWKDLPITVHLDDELSGYESVIELAMAEWDSHTGTVLFVSSVTSVNDADFDDPYNRDERNELSFGDYSEAGVIAVCRVWFSRRGRRIVEFDILFDIDFQPWGNVDVDGIEVMDVQNIATHEIGHGLNLGDIYDEDWSYLTMYGFADYGETIKRDLADGDIAGIQELYGAP